jgi:predicted DNA-binding transcriptional regulator AlpA
MKVIPMTTYQTDQLLTPSQTSEILGVSTQTLAIWRCNKRYNLNYVKVGRYVRYRYSDILSFIDAQTVAA